MERTADVLIVDDQPEIVDMISEVLADEGYTVRIACDGAAALAAVEERRPALVLVDYSMPGVSGAAFLRLLHLRGFADMPVVVMSAHTRLHSHDVLGATELLPKPFDLDVLLACVGRYMRPAAEIT